MANTLLLDQTVWDLVLDSNGNIAMASAPYALAQDVASAVRLFVGELWYDTKQGIPYFAQVLGQLPPASLLIQLIQNAAVTVPGVATASAIIKGFNNRDLSGQLQFTDTLGTVTVMKFNGPPSQIQLSVNNTVVSSPGGFSIGGTSVSTGVNTVTTNGAI